MNDDLRLTVGELDLICGGSWNILANTVGGSPPPPSPRQPTSGGHTGGEPPNSAGIFWVN
jgi:hypothetical protein